AVRNGHPSVLMPGFDVDRTLDWMQHRGLTHCGFVPTMIASLLDHPQSGAAPYPLLRRVLYGGAPMPPPLVRRAAEVFRCDLLNGFGAGTEVGGQTRLSAADH